MRQLRLAPALAAALALACAPAGTGTPPLPVRSAVFRVPAMLDGPRRFLNLPFPSDVDVRPDGTRVLQSFPNPTSSTVLEDYRGLLNQGRGWSLNGAIFIAFDGPLDAAALPTPEQTLQASSPVQLVDIDPASPERGHRIPLRLRFEAAETQFLPAHVLVALPVLGFPMRPATTYALVVRGGTWAAAGFQLAPSADLAALLADAAPQDSRLTRAHTAYAPLRSAADVTGIPTGDLAHATVFTTADPLPELVAAREVVLAGAPYPTSNWRHVQEYPSFHLYEGTQALPQFPRGDAPWDRFDGVSGTFQRGADGKPVVQRTEDVKFAVTVPKGTPPAGGWPVVVVAHGTGGNYLSFVGTRPGDESTWLGAAGCVGVSISQPIHETRAGYNANATELNTFNFLNPNGAKGIWRQSALESSAMLHSLSAYAPPLDVAVQGQVVPLNTSLKLFFGHSQGGISGAIMAGVETDLDLAVLSGAGGGFAESLLEKTEPVRIADALRLVLALPEGEPLDEFHPVLSVVQLMTEELEPLNHMRRTYTPGRKAPDLLILSGQTDAHTPPRTHGPLAAAAGIPPLGPLINAVPSLDLQGLAPLTGTVSANIPLERTGSRAGTAVLAQFPGDHFVIYRDRTATDLATRFVQTFLQSGTASASR